MVFGRVFESSVAWMGWNFERSSGLPSTFAGGSAIWRLFGDVRTLALEATMYLINDVFN
jgi:uncharacterized protein (DUF2236 family)